MFDQHPVPQQISSYQFRLVGDMTIKQFFQIAAGAVVALIFYGLPFPVFIKWPLIIISALSGAAFAFLPIQDRPLEQWLFAFFRSIYSPTYYVWKKQDPAPQYFKVDTTQPVQQTALTDEQQHAQDLKNGVEVEEDTLYKPDFIAGAEENNQIAAQEVAAEENVINGQSNNIGTSPLAQGSTYEGQVLTDSGVQNQVEEKKAELEVPKQNVVEVQKQGYEDTQTQNSSTQQPVYQSQQTPVQEVLQEKANQQSTILAQFSPDAAPPLPPELPNIIKGQVMDSAGHIVDGAILEIKDEAGRPVRAIRSNKAGHFQIVTSLPDGKYTISIEKEGYNFTPITIDATGEIINPIAIRAN